MALQHLRSATLDKRPTPGAMSDGQIALNTNATSPGLFFKDSNGVLVKSGPVHVGTTAPNVTPGGQAGNSKGEVWLDTAGATPLLKVYDGTAFVTTSGSADVVGPASSTDNAVTRFDSTTGKLLQNSLVTIGDTGAITAPSVGSIIPFYFANQAAFPPASTYHGAIAHSHSDGAMYYAHGGAWLPLAALGLAQSYTAQQRGAITALTDGATITADFALANNFSVTLGGSRTLANPTNQTAGASGSIWITQDGTGSRTLAYGANWDFSGGTAPTLSTAAGAVDCLVYAVQSSTKITATLITDLS